MEVSEEGSFPSLPLCLPSQQAKAKLTAKDVSAETFQRTGGDGRRKKKDSQIPEGKKGMKDEGCDERNRCL